MVHADIASAANDRKHKGQCLPAIKKPTSHQNIDTTKPPPSRVTSGVTTNCANQKVSKNNTAYLGFGQSTQVAGVCLCCELPRPGPRLVLRPRLIQLDGPKFMYWIPMGTPK
ncbi:hypothetical protein EVAR_19091_1 [Eumeta japonica]|uniref:Uncharacterized protein n=1 Tax=Eumeta variegata TaxID=151549 RepID=A0A4C1UQI5_EUMVA|nr:hypothetical protein EVAR_19091_1 [Eumeta japonica]